MNLHHYLTPFARQVLKQLILRPADFTSPELGDIQHQRLGGFEYTRFGLRHVRMRRGDFLSEGRYVDADVSVRRLPLLDQWYLRRQFNVWAQREVDMASHDVPDVTKAAQAVNPAMQAAAANAARAASPPLRAPHLTVNEVNELMQAMGAGKISQLDAQQFLVNHGDVMGITTQRSYLSGNEIARRQDDAERS